MRVIFGVLLIIAGVIVGAYVGIWLMLVGGIIQIVEAFQSDPVNGSDVAWGVVRCLLASMVGGLAFYAVTVAGFLLIGSADSRPRDRVGGGRTAKQALGDYRRHF